MDGNTALGASSPANPALHMPEPLSTTKAATSSSHMLMCLCVGNLSSQTVFTGWYGCLDGLRVKNSGDGAGFYSSRLEKFLGISGESQ